MPGPSLRSRPTIYLLAILVGAIAGVGALLFEYGAAWVVRLALVGVAGYAPVGPRGEVELIEGHGGHAITWWWLLLLPSVGCFASGARRRILLPAARRMRHALPRTPPPLLAPPSCRPARLLC